MSMQTRNDAFIEVLLESMAAAKVTIENEYMSLIFSQTDFDIRFYIMFLVNLSWRVPTMSFLCQKFFTLRLPTVDSESFYELVNVTDAQALAVFSNLADSLRKEAHGKNTYSKINIHWDVLSPCFRPCKRYGSESAESHHRTHLLYWRSKCQRVLTGGPYNSFLS